MADHSDGVMFLSKECQPAVTVCCLTARRVRLNRYNLIGQAIGYRCSLYHANWYRFNNTRLSQMPDDVAPPSYRFGFLDARVL